MAYSGNDVGHMNEVKLRRAQLALGLVTTLGGYTISVFPGHLAWSSRRASIGLKFKNHNLKKKKQHKKTNKNDSPVAWCTKVALNRFENRTRGTSLRKRCLQRSRVARSRQQRKSQCRYHERCWTSRCSQFAHLHFRQQLPDSRFCSLSMIHAPWVRRVDRLS